MNYARMPEQLRIDTDDLESVRGGTYFGEDMNYQGKPFTGFRLAGYYKNGQVACETQHVDGEQLGWTIEYYENGDVEKETLRLGATLVYTASYNRNGEKIKSLMFSPDLLDEVCTIIGEDPKSVDR